MKKELEKITTKFAVKTKSLTVEDAMLPVKGFPLFKEFLGVCNLQGALRTLLSGRPQQSADNDTYV